MGTGPDWNQLGATTGVGGDPPMGAVGSVICADEGKGAERVSAASARSVRSGAMALNGS